jgi:hypothetical protein
MTVTGRMLFKVVAALAASLVSAGTSHAGLDNELSLVDGKDRTMTIQQWDTFLDGVFRLDRKRLTREWFHWPGRTPSTVRVSPISRAPWSWATRSASVVAACGHQLQL